MKEEYCGAWIPEEMKEDFIKKFAKRKYSLSDNQQLNEGERANG
ncbi:hypothetical protein LCGC14_3047750 [marine sediment metagenome]|uniref:Uncharacterized protein n=1 Tax=marine sediment metagenome TaxID=412755 RepID=A0A0F8WMJ8_9ZZZZ